QQTRPGAYRTHTRLAFADSGFCLIPQSFVKKLVGPACPPSQVSASAYSPRLMSEPEPEPPTLWIQDLAAEAKKSVMKMEGVKSVLGQLERAKCDATGLAV